MNLDSYITLNNGVNLPRFGLGVWRSKSGSETEDAVLWALEAGYRHIDTAAIYKNESDVGKALRKSGKKREDIFITSKIWNTDMRANRQLEAFSESLERLGTDYIDLYLIHWPVENFVDSWRVLEDIYKSGRARAIGVSNFKAHHLDTLLQNCTVVPAVDQMEFNPYIQDNEAIAKCRENGIVYEAWAPLGAGSAIGDERIVCIAEKYGKSSAQVILRWIIQRNIVVFPKSVHKERIIENADIFDFELSEEDILALNAMNCGKRSGSDPDTFTF